MTDEKKEIEAWMFRFPGEYLSLLISLGLLVVAGWALSTFNIYFAVGIALVALVYIKLQQAQFMGNSVRVHEEQFGEIFEVFRNHARSLNIQRASLFIVLDPSPNAFTLGFNSCSVVLTSALVEQFSPAELSFTIAHELGHYKAGHTKISSVLIPIGSGNVFSNLIFGFWQRKTEYSADRCGLVLTKDIDPAITGLIKLSIGGKLFEKINLHGYLSQMKKAEDTSVKISEVLVDHPLTTNRVKNLILFWKESFARQQ